MNDKNLIPQAHTLTVEEASKGGRASVETRRKRKAMRELMREALAVEVTNAKGETKSLDEIGALKVAEKYAKGDLKAAEFIAKLLGEFEQRVKIDGEIKGVNILVGSQDTADKLKQILGKE